MRLEDLTIALRPRQSWEAADLGCVLVRRDYGSLLLIWLMGTLPIWLLLAVLLWRWPHAFGLIAWWLKPLYDRLPLYFLSRAAFGSKPSLREMLRVWPSLWRRFLPSSLLWRRFSLMRSFTLPVQLLEGQKGNAARQRIQTLSIDGGSSGAILTWVFLKLEIAIWIGLAILLSTIGPGHSPPNLIEWFRNPDEWSDMQLNQLWFSNLIYLISMTLIEPFYVGAGFGLYLNSRIKIEGWDIELTFRRLASRLQSSLGLLLLLGIFGAAQPLPAKNLENANQVLKEILAHPEFKEHSRQEKTWVSNEPEKESQPTPPIQPLVEAILYITAFIILAAALIMLGLWITRNRHLFHRLLEPKQPPDQSPLPRVVMGLNIDRESLPHDILATARALWQEDRRREALSLLYRGALSHLVERLHLPIRDSDTEDDCLQHVARTGETELVDFFRELTNAWVRMAYAHHEIHASEFDAFCQTWPFQEPPQRHHAHALAKTTLLLACSLPLLAGCNGHWEETTVPTGYKGKARLDPFLAAQRLLNAFDHEASRHPKLGSLPNAQTGVILISAETGISQAHAQQLLNWAQTGGHLIYALNGCSPYNDWNALIHTHVDPDDPILKRLDITSRHTSNQSSSDEKKNVSSPWLPLKIQGASYKVDFPTPVLLAMNRPLRKGEFAAGKHDGAAMLSLRHGQGRITVLNHAQPLRNRYLDEHDHARWLLALIGPDPRQIQFIVSLHSSFWALLWSRAWMPLIGLGLLILAWLWSNLRRFGPLRTAELHDTRHFVDHISALGQFFHRLRRDDILLQAAVQSVCAAAQRRYPHLQGTQDPALLSVLTSIGLLPEERIRAAMEAARNAREHAPHELVRYLHDLQTLKAALN